MRRSLASHVQYRSHDAEMVMIVIDEFCDKNSKDGGLRLSNRIITKCKNVIFNSLKTKSKLNYS